MMFSQTYDANSIKASFENEFKGNSELIQKRLNEVNELLKKEQNETCIRKPMGFRGPLPQAVQKYLMEIEILEDMLKDAKLRAESTQAKPC